VFAALLTVVLTGLPMPGEAEAQAFTANFERGETLYSRGDYGAAVTLFREADRLKVTPEVAYDLARSFEKLGDLAFTTLYDRLYVARAPDASDAPDISERVNRTLNRAEDEGRSFVEVFSPGATSLTVAGRRFPAPPAALFLPPGEYVIEGAFSGGVKTMKLQVRAGRVSTVWFEPMRPPVRMEEPAPERALHVERPAAPTRGPSGVRVASYVALGLGAAALIGGAVAGGLASADATRSQDLLLTVREATDVAERSNAKATAANVLFVAGGVVAAAGGVLFVVSLPGPGEESKP
jgi:hypothetical protein